MLTPKYNNDAEKEVLGAILLEGLQGESRALKKIALQPEDFYKGDHRAIFEAMVKIDAEKRPADFITLSGLLTPEQIQKLKEIAGETVTAANIKHHAEIVREKAGLRRFQKMCIDVLGEIESGDIEDPASAVMKLSAGLKTITQNRTGNIISMKEFVKRTLERVEHRYENKGRLSGLPSGFADLDRLTDGFQKGDLIVIAGRPGQGKTALGMEIVQHIAEMGTAAGVINLEMGVEQLGTRALSSTSTVPMWALNKGALRMQEWQKITNATGHLAQLPIHFSFTARTLKSVQAEISGLIENKGCKTVLIDYLQLIRNPEEKIREREIGSISIMFKEIAQSMDIPVIVLSQLNREVEKRPDKRPYLSDLRDSGQIEQDADIIIFIYPSKEEGIQNVEIAKGRNVGTGNVELIWDKMKMKFSDR